MNDVDGQSVGQSGQGGLLPGEARRSAPQLLGRRDDPAVRGETGKGLGVPVLADHRQRGTGGIKGLCQVVDIAADTAALGGDRCCVEQDPRFGAHGPPAS